MNRSPRRGASLAGAVFAALAIATAMPPATAQVTLPEDEMALAAARQGNVALWRAMLAQGASPHARDAAGNGAVLLAVMGEREEMRRLVLAAGVDPNGRGNAGLTALGAAALRGHEGLVGRLLAAGADPDAADAAGRTPLAAAARLGRTSIVRRLLAAGADADRADELRATALHHAAEAGHADIVAALLAAGADPNRLDRDGRSPLFVAMFERHTAAAEALARHHRSDPLLAIQGASTREWAERLQVDAVVALLDRRLRR